MTISYKLAAGIAGKDPRKCVLCGHTKRLIVEHCHAHDAVRGLVCASCNQRLAQLDAGTKQATDAERFYLDNCPDCRRGRGDDPAASQGVLDLHAAAIGRVMDVMRRVGCRAVTIDMVQSDFGFSRPLTRAVYWSARARFDPSWSTRRRMRRANRIFDDAHRLSGPCRWTLDTIAVRFQVLLEKLEKTTFNSATPPYILSSIIINTLARGNQCGAFHLTWLIRAFNGNDSTAADITHCLRKLNRDRKIYRAFGGYLPSPELEYRYNPRLGGHIPEIAKLPSVIPGAADQHV